MISKIKHTPLQWPASVEQIWAYAKSWPSDIYYFWINNMGTSSVSPKARKKLKNKYPDYWNSYGKFDPFFANRNWFTNFIHKYIL